MRIVDPSLSGGASPPVMASASGFRSSPPKMAGDYGCSLFPLKDAPSSSLGCGGEGLLAGLGGGGQATTIGAEGVFMAGKEAGFSDKAPVESGNGENGKSRSRPSIPKEPGEGRTKAMLKKLMSYLVPECSSPVSLECLEGDYVRECQQPILGDHLSSLEGADQSHEVGTGHLKKALLAVSEVGAVEMTGEENRKAARSSTGSPKHIYSIFNEGFNLECLEG